MGIWREVPLPYVTDSARLIGFCTNRQLLFDHLFKSRLRQGATYKNAVDEEAGRTRDTRAHPFLAVLLDLFFVPLAGHARNEFLLIEL